MSWATFRDNTSPILLQYFSDCAHILKRLFWRDILILLFVYSLGDIAKLINLAGAKTTRHNLEYVAWTQNMDNKNRNLGTEYVAWSENT